MTYNEFKFCCSLFFETYKNLTMNDIFKDDSIKNVNTTIKNVNTTIKDMKITDRGECYGVGTDKSHRCYGSGTEIIFYFYSNALNLNGYCNIVNFEKYRCENIKKFINVYKINLEDIV